VKLKGFNVHYVTYDDPHNSGSFRGEVTRVTAQHPIEEVVVTAPGEYRLSSEMDGWSATLGLPVTITDDDRFLCSPREFAAWADGRKQLRMEFFYREMRRKYNILMDQGEPIGGDVP